MDAISEPDIDTLQKAFEKAYAATLKKYHNWILQKTLNVGTLQLLTQKICGLLDLNTINC